MFNFLIPNYMVFNNPLIVKKLTGKVIVVYLVEMFIFTRYRFRFRSSQDFCLVNHIKWLFAIVEISLSPNSWDGSIFWLETPTPVLFNHKELAKRLLVFVQWKICVDHIFISGQNFKVQISTLYSKYVPGEFTRIINVKFIKYRANAQNCLNCYFTGPSKI